jgi:hypothetical protein
MGDERSRGAVAMPERATATRPANQITDSTVAPPHQIEPPAEESQPNGDPSPFSRGERVEVRPPVSHAERREFTPGSELEDWLEAERELVGTATTLARGIR